MTVDQLGQALLRQFGARREGSVYQLPSDADTSMLVALEGETLTIPRISRVDVGADPMVVAETAKGETFVFEVASLRAIKAEGGDGQKRGSGAGFVR